ncbi:hypothetical protein HFP57_14975 [Parasphingopyxis algicola]|uniref:hypothetical protein n=1 Tax=Parasphingopyxis algicola TaxID=2026624 RepID=UPI0015A2A5C2|nr:hypothetical protein [Parasphingopyxis algicola]QLC26200.1 hypothetical protein HFP57_14975 [Parasphingopyxis algicola]
MRNAVFWVVALLALLWNGFGLYDLYMTLTINREYLAQFPPEMMAMIEAFPEWRRLLWTTSVFLGVIAAVLLLLRRAMAERVFWATAVTMAAGFIGYDLPFGNGLEAYGVFGVIFSFVLIAVQIVLALYARWAARHALIK